MAEHPAVTSLRPFAVVAYRSGLSSPSACVPDDAVVGDVLGEPLYARDLRRALWAVEEHSPVSTLRQRRWTRLKAIVGSWFPQPPENA